MSLIARNAAVFTFSGIDKTQFAAALDKIPFTPMTGLESSRLGFVPPINGDASLIHFAADVGAFALRMDSKILPASVVAAEVAHRAEEIEEQQGYRMGRKARKELTEQVTDELLPKAFTRTTLIRGFVDFANGRLVIDAAAPGKVEEVVIAISRGIDKAHDSDTSAGVQIRPWRTANDPGSVVTGWLHSGDVPTGITIDNMALIENEEGGKVRISKLDVNADEFRNLLTNGSSVTELAITIDDVISITLTDKLMIKRITHLDMTSHDERTADMFEDQLREAEIILNAGAVSTVMSAIDDAMGGAKVALMSLSKAAGPA